MISRRKRKRPADFAQRAKMIVEIATGEIEDREPTPEEQGKDPAAVSLGRRGGLKGGTAGAKSMTSNTTLADLLTPLLVPNPFSAMRASLLWWPSDKFENGLTHGWQSWLRRRAADSFFPALLF